ncbi:MAG: orotidine 5'-phosphate decarboxylase [Desulfobulbaceae bacterium]|nr:orotidine 5'-phosphate decarboxylase [Desulfobulbaceae bacterium]
MVISKFKYTKGILFAADLDDEQSLYNCLDEVVEYIKAIKVGNALLYTSGPYLISKLKNRYNMPVVADLKLTDVSHIATRVASIFADNGADAIMLSGVCGKTVFKDVLSKTSDGFRLSACDAQAGRNKGQLHPTVIPAKAGGSEDSDPDILP